MTGPVFAIGGHEDRSGERVILKAVAEALPRPRLAVVTIASEVPGDLLETYESAFGDLAVELVHVHADDRAGAEDARALEGVGGVFFTGGSQLRLTSVLGDTALETAILDAWHGGAVIAGTSAGASVLAGTMIVRGRGSETPSVDDVDMAPGLAVLPHLVIDQHFAQRGRIGRLAAAIARNPRLLGVGIDEDTAIVARDGSVEVIGEGSVTVLDASTVTATNVADASDDATLSVFDLCAHVLAPGDRFDLESRRPAARD